MKEDEIHELLKLFLDYKYHTAESIAATLGISSKKVRSMIKELNATFFDHCAMIENKAGTGFCLHVVDTQVFEQFCHYKKRSRNLSGEDRLFQLLWLLLDADSYIKMDEVSSRLFLSKSTLSDTMKAARQYLENYNLELIHKPYYGMRIEGGETDYRRCLAKLLSILAFTESLNFEFQMIERCIITCLHTQSMEISDYALENVLCHIYASVIRMKKGHYLKKEESDGGSGSVMDLVISELSGLLEKQYEIIISKEEREQIGIILDANKLIVGREHMAGDTPIINSQIFQVVQEMLQSVYTSFRIDFRDDFDLIMALCMHIEPLSLRLLHDVECANPLLPEIKTKFSLAYTIAVQACGVVAQHWRKTVSEDEIGFIALAFALAIEKKKNTVKKKNILIVCGTGYGGAQLLAYQYRIRFQDYIRELKVCNSSELIRMDLIGFDYIFSIVPIEISVPVPIIILDNFFEERDIQKVRKVLRSKSASGIEQYYPKDLFLTDLKFHNKDEALEFLCRHVMVHRDVSENFYEEVLKREELAKTEYGNMVAMPHPYSIENEDTFVCVAILETPVLWESRKVRVIFLVSVGKSDIIRLQDFYQITSEFLMNKTHVKNLIKTKDYSKFIQTMKEIQEAGRI